MTASIYLLLLFTDNVEFIPPPPPGDSFWVDNNNNKFINNLGNHIVFNPG